MGERAGRQGTYKWFIGAGLVALATIAVVVSSVALAGRPAPASQSGTGQPAQSGASSPVKVIAGTPSPQVRITWFDSVALVQWEPMAGAKGYRITLVRLRDGAITQQADVPATQTAFDAQGIWPNEKYQVVVQPLDAKKKAGTALYSPVGQAVPINRARYNGFLDTMNIAEGPIDPTLWDQRGYFAMSTSSSFINTQIHGHIETGEIAYEQSMIGISPRAPFDFTNRTGTIHGEVDLHGDISNWFGAVLAPRQIAPTEFIDSDDRNFHPFDLPMLEVFNDSNGVTVYESVPGKDPYVIGHYKPTFTYVNVRHVLDWKVSTAHVELLVDGQVAVNADLPARLPFSVGYLTLVAESYPKLDNDFLGHVTPCDDVGGECNTWHLDNWGFDAPSSHGAMPATGVATDVRCPLSPTDELTQEDYCGEQRLSTSPVEYKVNVTDASAMRSAAVVMNVSTWDHTAPVQVSVNGGPWVTSPYENGNGLGAVFTFPFNPSLLHSGENTVRVKLATESSQGVSSYNLLVNQVYQRAYKAPALPSERSPLGSWKFGDSPHALINANALASIACSTLQPNGTASVSSCCGCCSCADDRTAARRNTPATSA